MPQEVVNDEVWHIWGVSSTTRDTAIYLYYVMLTPPSYWGASWHNQIAKFVSGVNETGFTWPSVKLTAIFRSKVTSPPCFITFHFTHKITSYVFALLGNKLVRYEIHAFWNTSIQKKQIHTHSFREYYLLEYFAVNV